MGGGTPHGEPSVGSDTPRQKGKATPETLKTGCIAWVEKDGQPRRAEILSIKETKSGKHYYCNFDNFNKRLDEWVPVARIDFTQEVEWPNPEKDKPKDSKTKKVPSNQPKKSQVSKKAQKRPGKREQSVNSEATTPHPWTEFVETQGQRKSSSVGPEAESQAGVSFEASATPGAGDDLLADEKEDEGKKDEHGFSREEEIEKLRTSGSMTQNPAEISRIRNISKVQFGKNDLFPWYFSPYPEIFALEDVIYICEFCLSYYGDEFAFTRHRKKCTLQHPPGNEIYRDDYVSFFEIDGRRQRTWCRNLCLLSKMFLDHKTLYYDVDPFLFYVMTMRTDKGCHIRKGYGRLLIQFSYELSKIEGKLGSPEKPLSDLGLLSYRQYWSENILDLLLGYNERDEKVTIEAISTALAMTTQDVEHTLQAMKMQVYHKSDHKIVIPERLIEQREKQKLKRKRVLDPLKIQWKPPVFTASSPSMSLSLLAAALLGIGAVTPVFGRGDSQIPFNYADACPDYALYASYPHSGPLALPYQRPSPQCRTFHSDEIERVIEEVTSRIKDPDLARLFENTFPSTTDTTVKFHTKGGKNTGFVPVDGRRLDDGAWEGPQSFIITGDIIAEWLRDSTNQLRPYQGLAKKDPAIFDLIVGAINTQSEYVIQSPYCNAFQPPPISELSVSANGQDDIVHPAYEPSVVFECKYELDSLAHFLALANDFYEATGATDFVNKRWLLAVDTLLLVLKQQSEPTFHPETGQYDRNTYTFQRWTNAGTETLNLQGVGNPLNSGTGLVRSAFRPSDDATILGFFIPANAMMSVELGRAAKMLQAAGNKALATKLGKWSEKLRAGVLEHGVVKHKKYGDVFAYEVDGYGSSILMDDANYPSLLALPVMGFCDVDDPVYQNTRKMILDKQGNPYYLKGRGFQGIGGPHIGLKNAWPMSLLLQAQTSNDDKEIKECIDMVLKASPRGLIHESVDVNYVNQYTRSWFAWANGVFAVTILDLAKRKPHLVFGPGAAPYEM
ncbi:hypothetical protein N5P37_011698 [Trichoderma harzianum]|nr:hypothetical protein N5P37_011698 [Trichoderma harzianum]